MSNADIGVAVVNGKVVLKFFREGTTESRNVQQIELDHQNAIDIARGMTDAAWELRDGVKPVGDSLKAELIERHRDTLRPRLNIMLNSTRENKTVTNGKLAMSIIDVIFSEIFS